MSRRPDFRETTEDDPNSGFRWCRMSKSIKWDTMDSLQRRVLVNHFEFARELDNKRNLFENLRFYSEHHKTNVFDTLPVTFVLSLDDDRTYYEFLWYFRKLEDLKGKTCLDKMLPADKNKK